MNSDGVPSNPPKFHGEDKTGKAAELHYSAELDDWKESRKAILGERLTRLEADTAERLKRLEADAAERQARAEADIALEKASWDSEWKFHDAFHAAVMDVAKGSLERNGEAAKFVETAASAVAVAYTGILTFSFVAAEGTPLPATGMVPGVFLALAIALAAGYLGFLTDPGSTIGPTPTSSVREYQWRRTNAFTRWVKKQSFARASLLRGSVLSLGMAALLLPAPFIDFDPDWIPWVILGVGLAAVLGYAFFVGDTESPAPTP